MEEMVDCFFPLGLESDEPQPDHKPLSITSSQIRTLHMFSTVGSAEPLPYARIADSGKPWLSGANFV